MMMGYYHKVSNKKYYLAIASSTKEKENVEEDLKVAFDIIGPYKHKFVNYETMYSSKPYSDEIYVTETLDATSHFESAAEDVLKIYKEITGKELDLQIKED